MNEQTCRENTQDIRDHETKLVVYHKRLGNVEKTSERFGERLGCLEQSDAVQENRLDSIDGTLKDIKNSVSTLPTLPWKMIGAMAAMVTILGVVLRAIQ